MIRKIKVINLFIFNLTFNLTNKYSIIIQINALLADISFIILNDLRLVDGSI